MYKILGIVACDPNGVIGNQGKLPWNYPEDIKFFSKTIENTPLIMGRKTLDGLPGKYIKNRKVIVFSRDLYKNSENIIWVSSLEEFRNLELPSPIFLLGGGELFSLFLENHMLHECFVTHIHKCYDGDAFFPLPLLEGWKKTILDEKEDLTFCYYESLTNCHA
ncbi:dihydrofolate reductase [Chlamydia sp. 12-01]|uniref:dihydrofolate reductase n=1 Tax=Chlamydia sp. 12-01 TaxID=3002742 RepID=UPI0035D45C5F